MRAVPLFAFVLLPLGCASSSPSNGTPKVSADGAAPGADGSTIGGAGDDGGGTDGAPSVDPTAACATAAETACTKLGSCSMFALGAAYGDLDTCKKRAALACAPTFGAPQTSATPAGTVACAATLEALSCDDLLAGRVGDACDAKPGGIANGAACGEDAQCMSTFCARAPDTLCGTCAPLTKAGDPCVNSACSSGTTCPKGKTTCITPVPGKAGDACTAQAECDLGHAVGCNTANGKCIALTLAAQTCGANNIVTSFAVCPASATCTALFGGSCTPTAADGAACSTADTGAHCLPPARCAGGKCVLLDPTACL